MAVAVAGGVLFCSDTNNMRPCDVKCEPGEKKQPESVKTCRETDANLNALLSGVYRGAISRCACFFFSQQDVGTDTPPCTKRRSHHVRGDGWRQSGGFVFSSRQTERSVPLNPFSDTQVNP